MKNKYTIRAVSEDYVEVEFLFDYKEFNLVKSVLNALNNR